MVTCFGPDILIPGTKEGLEEVDRKKLGSIVFDNPEAMSVGFCIIQRIVNIFPSQTEELTHNSVKLS